MADPKRTPLYEAHVERGARIIDFGWSQQRTIRMEDITATMYSALGINWTKTIGDTPSGRRYEYVQYASHGLYSPVDEIF